MNTFRFKTLIFAVLTTLLLSGCGTAQDYKDIAALLLTPPPEHPPTDVSDDSQSGSNIDDIFARLDDQFGFEAPPEVSNPYGSWSKARGAQLKVIPGVSYEVRQPYTVYKGKIRSAYRGYSKNGQLWVWISLKKNGSGTKVRYRISGASNLSRAAEIMEDWIEESV